MSIIRAVRWKKLIFFGLWGVFLSTTIYFLYPKSVIELFGKTVPPMWTSDLGSMNFKEIYEKIGPPQDDASAKNYQNWL